MPDTARRWWTWPRYLFAVWSLVLTNWITFAVTNPTPRELYIIMWALITVMPIVALVGEFSLHQSNRQPRPMANPVRSRVAEPLVVPLDVDPWESTAHLPVTPPNGAPRQRVTAAASVAHGTEYRSAFCEPEPKPKKPKRAEAKSSDMPSLKELGLDPNDPRRLFDMDVRTDPRFQAGRRQGFDDAEKIRRELDDDDPPADGPTEDRQ
jgi:hypothetical protein